MWSGSQARGAVLNRRCPGCALPRLGCRWRWSRPAPPHLTPVLPLRKTWSRTSHRGVRTSGGQNRGLETGHGQHKSHRILHMPSSAVRPLSQSASRAWRSQIWWALSSGGGWGTQLEPVGVLRRPRPAPRVDRHFARHPTALPGRLPRVAPTVLQLDDDEDRRARTSSTCEPLPGAGEGWRSRRGDGAGEARCPPGVPQPGRRRQGSAHCFRSPRAGKGRVPLA